PLDLRAPCGVVLVVWIETVQFAFQIVLRLSLALPACFLFFQLALAASLLFAQLPASLHIGSHLRHCFSHRLRYLGLLLCQLQSLPSYGLRRLLGCVLFYCLFNLGPTLRLPGTDE
ncbi:unnamed protein product, partial [Ectocarpus sp. 12 AP-2014]